MRTLEQRINDYLTITDVSVTAKMDDAIADVYREVIGLLPQDMVDQYGGLLTSATTNYLVFDTERNRLGIIERIPSSVPEFSNYQCQKVDPRLKNQLVSGSIYEPTDWEPVYYIEKDVINVFPSTSISRVNVLGFSLVSTPTSASNYIYNLPTQIEKTIVVGTAAQLTLAKVAGLEASTLVTLNMDTLTYASDVSFTLDLASFVSMASVTVSDISSGSLASYVKSYDELLAIVSLVSESGDTTMSAFSGIYLGVAPNTYSISSSTLLSSVTSLASNINFTYTLPTEPVPVITSNLTSLASWVNNVFSVSVITLISSASGAIGTDYDFEKSQAWLSEYKTLLESFSTEIQKAQLELQALTQENQLDVQVWSNKAQTNLQSATNEFQETIQKTQSFLQIYQQEITKQLQEGQLNTSVFQIQLQDAIQDFQASIQTYDATLKQIQFNNSVKLQKANGLSGAYSLVLQDRQNKLQESIQIMQADLQRKVTDSQYALQKAAEYAKEHNSGVMQIALNNLQAKIQEYQTKIQIAQTNLGKFQQDITAKLQTRQVRVKEALDHYNILKQEYLQLLQLNFPSLRQEQKNG